MPFGSQAQPSMVLGLALCVVVLGTAAIDPSRLPLLLIPLSSWFACHGAGAALERAIVYPSRHDSFPLGSMVRRISVGLALLSSIALLSALAGVFWMAGIAVTASALPSLWSLFKNIRTGISHGWPGLPSRLNLFSGGILGLIGLLAWLWATIPPAFYDELAYHLVIPERTLATGTLPTYPWLFFTLMPHVSDLWLAWGMAMGGGLGARAMHWGVWVASIIAAWAIVDRFTPLERRRWSLPFLLGGLASSSMWWFLGTLSFAETGLTLSVLSAILALGVLPLTVRAWIPLGLLLGLMGSIKLSGMSWAVALLAATLVLRWPWKPLLGAMSVMTLTMCPWWIRAYVVTGDPLYPLAYNMLNTLFWNDQSQALLNGDLPLGVLGLGFWGTIRLPFDLVSHPEQHGSASEIGILPVLSIGLILIFPFIIRLTDQYREHRIAADAVSVFVLLAGCAWIFTSTTTRFFAPAFVLGTAVFVTILLHMNRTITAATGILLVPLALFGTWRFLDAHHQVFSGTQAALGREDPVSYIRKQLLYYDAADFVAHNVPVTARLLFIGEARTYYFSRNTLAPYPFSPHPLAEWIASSASVPDLAHRLAGEGITHVVLNIPEFRRLHAHYHVLQFAGDQAAFHDRRLHELPGTLRTLFSKNGVHVFEVPASP